MHRFVPPCAALALLLAGCADDGTWTKPGATEDKIAAELDGCRDEARVALQRDAGIDADIMATRGTDWQRTGTLGINRDEMAAHRSGGVEAFVARCMAAKGFRRAE
jgi:hypothetical protein